MERMLLRVSEACEVLALGRSKVYELIEEGRLPVVRIDRAVRIPRDELNAWIDEQKVVLKPESVEA